MAKDNGREVGPRSIRYDTTGLKEFNVYAIQSLYSVGTVGWYIIDFSKIKSNIF